MTEPYRILIIKKNGCIKITNSTLLFGDPELLKNDFRFLMPDGSHSKEEYWLSESRKTGIIYREV